MELFTFLLGCFFGGIVIPLLMIGLFVFRRSILDGGRVADLGKKYILITGANGGFGLALAKRLDQDGCKVIATCRTQEGVNKVKQLLSSRVIAIQMDVEKENSILAAEKTVRGLLPTPDALWCIVNNAGVTCTSPFDLHDLDQFRHVVNVNFVGVAVVIKYFLPYLKRSKGRIVNIGSIASRLPGPFASAYASSKAALAGFNSSLRRELSAWGISVHLIEPGLYKYGMGDKTRYISAFQDMVDDLPEGVNEEYKKLLQDGVKSIEKIQAFGNSNITRLIDYIEHAAISTNPKSFVVSGNDILVYLARLNIFPDAVGDFLFKWKQLNSI